MSTATVTKVKRSLLLTGLSIYSPEFEARKRTGKDDRAEKRARDWQLLPTYRGGYPTFTDAQNSYIDLEPRPIIPALELYENGEFALLSYNQQTGEAGVFCQGRIDVTAYGGGVEHMQREIMKAMDATEPYISLYGIDTEGWFYSLHCKTK